MAGAQENVNGTASPSTMDEELAALRHDFPGFRIWREEICDRVRYVARRQLPGLHPHTVITDDPGELRHALKTAGPQLPFSPDKPSIARIYDYLLHGKDHYQPDREAAESVLEKFPEVADIAQANRAFVVRAVRHVARQGIRQFIDAGAGLPASPNVHEVAREITGDVRVVYADDDPMVLAHARALLAVDGQVSVVAADIRDPEAMLASPGLRGFLDLRQPVCGLLASVLHFLPAGEADAAVAAFRRLMTPGSYLVISAGTSTGTDPELISCLQAAYDDTAPVTGRTAEEINAWFTGLTLARPGLTDVWAWRPEDPQRPPQPGHSRARFLAGVGRKPADEPAWPGRIGEAHRRLHASGRAEIFVAGHQMCLLGRVPEIHLPSALSAWGDRGVQTCIIPGQRALLWVSSLIQAKIVGGSRLRWRCVG